MYLTGILSRYLHLLNYWRWNLPQKIIELFSGCDDIITANNGTLTSTNYPNDYYDNMDCRTVIRVSLGSRIRVNFLDFNTERNYDYLTVILFIASEWIYVINHLIQIDSWRRVDNFTPNAEGKRNGIAFSCNLHKQSNVDSIHDRWFCRCPRMEVDLHRRLMCCHL